MPRPGEDDREAVDRAFADLIAGYHLTSDRPDPLADPGSRDPSPPDQGAVDQALPDQPARDPQPESAATATEAEALETGWADSHPLFHFPDQPVAEETPEAEEQFVPEPPIPLPRPAWPVMVAWIAMGYAVLAVLAISMGVTLPAWAGWAALISFVGGFGILLSQLPRHRPPDAGNGAVL